MNLFDVRIFIDICTYACNCMYMYIYIHTYIHIYIYIHIHIYISTYIHIHLYTHTHIPIYLYIVIYIYMRVYIYIYMYMYSIPLYHISCNTQLFGIHVKNFCEMSCPIRPCCDFSSSNVTRPEPVHGGEHGLRIIRK